MRIVLLREIPDDQLLRQQWDALVGQMQQPEVFYTYEWALSVQRSFSSFLQPILLLGYEGDCLIGVAALALKPGGEPGFLSDITADYCDLVSLPGLCRQWCDAVFGELRKLHIGRLSLGNVPADSPTLSSLSEAAAKHGYRTFARTAYDCARIVLGGEQQRASLRRGTTGKKALRRNLRLLGGEHTPVFSVNPGEEDLDHVVASFCGAHVARFLSSGRLSNLIQPERRAFLRELARQLWRRGWLSLNRLVVGDKCVAWNYGLQFAGSWFWYQPTFDTKYERFSPGLCLLAKVIEAACDNPQIGVVDLGLGAEEYKEKFANASRRILHITINSSPVPHAKAILRSGVAEALKARPGVEITVRRAVNRVSRVRSSLREQGLSASVAQITRAVGRSFFSAERVRFYRWCGDAVGPHTKDTTSRGVDMDLLGVAAMEYWHDRPTLDYLLDAAQRLRAGQEGFALVTGSGSPVHFCWLCKFEDYEVRELKERLSAPAKNAVLILQCWTPSSMHDRNYAAIALAGVAGRVCSSGQVPWTIATARDHASSSSFLKAGFSYQFTLRRHLWLGITGPIQTEHKSEALPEGVNNRDYGHPGDRTSSVDLCMD